jgi:hypothetical protein
MKAEGVSFTATKEEAAVIARIVARALPMAAAAGVALDGPTLSMDLTAANANGCQLDFAKLEGFPDGDFGHDVFGIRRHIDRKTGELGNSFVPRCAR